MLLLAGRRERIVALSPRGPSVEGLAQEGVASEPIEHNICPLGQG